MVAGCWFRRIISTVMKSNPLPYCDRLAQRPLEAVRLAVVHATELPTLQEARTYGEQIHYCLTSTGNSGHYYIDRDGSVECWVPLERAAHHVRHFNQHSVGIELVNLGRFPNWLHQSSQSWQEPYSEAQLSALEHLLGWLKQTLPSLRLVTGHDQLDLERVPATDACAHGDGGGIDQVRRKLDPGPLFPWSRIVAATGLNFVAADNPLLTELKDQAS